MTTIINHQCNLGRLSRYQRRQFVSEGANLTGIDVLRGFYDQLLSRRIPSSQQLERWILDWSELKAAVHQEGAILYIRMTCQTDDQASSKAYQDYVETIIPMIKTFEDQLNRRFLEAIEEFPLDQERYEVYQRAIRTDVELFVKDNISLQTQVDLLSQEYQTICGAMTVEFDGHHRTLPEMRKFLLESDRPLRERAWRAISQRRLQDKDRLDGIFDKMLFLRNKIAQNAQCHDFCEYTFRALHRFDYTADDCRSYHESIEEIVVPLWEKILRDRQSQMKLEDLCPWDTSVDPLGRPALKPFEHVGQLINGCQKVFSRIDEELGRQFSHLIENDLLDLASRKGKAPGGYQSTLDEARKPFIFMNAVGLDEDVRTLLHEGGHAFHALACAHEPVVDYRHGPMEFNEVASMGMELLAGEHLDVFYNPEEERRSRKKHLEGIVYTLIWVAIIDAFQHWIYQHPGHPRQERVHAWLAIHRRFGGNFINWEGLEEELAVLWHHQLHIFEYPFYYIEYGIAQLGALQLWLNAKHNWTKALSDYQKGLSLGGSRPLRELFSTAGLHFDFSKDTIAPLMEAVINEFRKL